MISATTSSVYPVHIRDLNATILHLMGTNHELLDRVLISHDAGWYSVGEPRGGNFRPYDTLFTEFLPAL